MEEHKNILYWNGGESREEEPLSVWDAFPDPQSMSEQELKDCLAQLQKRLWELDQREPADENTEAFELWADAHEELEDFLDEVQECLDEL